MTLVAAVRTGYAGAGEGWATATALAYRAWAEHLVGRLDGDLTDRLVLDAGAGTGAATDALLARGARVVATDLVPSMLSHDAAGRPPAVAAEVASLPFRSGACAAAVAAFVLNHVADPAVALVELARVVRPGGRVAASSFSVSRDPAKDAVDAVLVAHGWQPPSWYLAVRQAGTQVGRVEQLARSADAAGFAAVAVYEVAVELHLSPLDVVRYRLAMPQTSAFVAALGARRRDALVGEAVEAVAAAPFRPLVLELVAHVA